MIANKMDLPESEENLRQLKKKVRGLTIIPVSAENDPSFEELKEKLQLALRQIGNPPEKETE